MSDDCIIATNTSSLSVASIAASLAKPERCIGIHFFNPAPLMKLVEVIPAIQTSQETLKVSVKTIKDWGKTVAVTKDTPGFIVNRVARPFYGEALRIYEEGIASFAEIDTAMKEIGGFRNGSISVSEESVIDSKASQKIFDRILVMLINEAADALYWNVASAEDIDNAMTKGVNYPKGLLAWANEKGIEWCVKKMDELNKEYLEDRYRCSPLLRKMSAQGNVFEV